MLTKTAFRLKVNADGKLGQYLQKGFDSFYVNDIHSANSLKYRPLLKLRKGINLPKPDLQNPNEKNIALYLQGQWDEEWGAQLVELINNEVLIDKKNQNPNSIKITPLFAGFIAKKFKLMVPQLERLMVRS